MSDKYQLIGAELSPYSIKTRSYLRYKNIPHNWSVGGPGMKGDFSKYAKLPIVPLLITPDGQGMQDSTPIMEALEMKYPQPCAVPEDPALAFISRLLEEYADEWGNKHMFHYRWKAEADQNSASLRLAEMRMPLALRYIPIANSVIQGRIATMIKKRMVTRAWVIGSNAETEGRIEASFSRLCGLLQAHLDSRPYLFGGSPGFADFGLWGQIYNAWTDPTPRKIIESEFAGLKPWLNRMQNPEAAGPFESWAQLQPTLAPLLREEVGAVFLPWSAAVTKAMHAGAEEVTVEIDGAPFAHSVGGPQKYHVKSLAVLRDKYNEVHDKTELNAILAASGCAEYFN